MVWLTGALSLLMTAGFAKLTAVIVNRLLAFPQPKWLIGLTELIQLTLIAVYAVLTIRTLGQMDLIVLIGESLRNIATSSMIFLFLPGIVGFGMLIRSIIGYQFYRPPMCQTHVESRIVDIRRLSGGDWKQSLVGPRPMRKLALFPGNEQFTVEVSTKTFTLPGLPKEWDGISIVHLSDTHFRGAVSRAYFESVCQQANLLAPDLFVFTGDLLDDPSLLDWLPETLGQLKAPLGQYFILGNHDWYVGPPSIRNEFTRIGWTDIGGQTKELKSNTSGRSIILAGDETPWMGKHPPLRLHDSDDFRILLSHTPDNIQWARDHGIDLMLSGHTHGGQIRLPLIGPVYSPSRYGCRFASGVFWLDPTLLYVSRGLSGREPIRYRCRPELTKLVLKSGGVRI